jgi:N-acetylmuramoyl-L-alanine amidase
MRAGSRYHEPLSRRRVSPFAHSRPIVWTLVAAAFALAPWPAPSAQGASYTVYTADGRKSLPYRTASGVDLVSLDQVALLFNLTVVQDSLVGGLTVRGRGQTVLLIPGQSFASIGPGRIVSLPAPVQRDRGVWQVPVEFVARAVAPALDIRIDLRRPTHVILVGDVRLPSVTGHIDRPGPNARLTIESQPPAPHRITRTGNRLTIRFDAVALDWTPVTGVATDFIAGVRAEGTSVLVDLGPNAAGYRADDVDAGHLEITVLAPAPPPPPPPPPAPVVAPAPAPTPAPGGPVRPQTPEPAIPVRPAIDTTPGTLRTIVLDPGHGGDDLGAKGAKGTTEKDLVLQFAKRLKSAIESRVGLRVLLTRNGDDNPSVDRRAAAANNSKADLFISLHANASVLSSVSGTQILSLRLDDYRGRMNLEPSDAPVTVLGGGTRTIDVLPWDMAQIGFTDKSAAIAELLRRHLSDGHVPMFTRPVVQLPLRPLAGVAMPAVMVELGFLTNPADEQALTGGGRAQQIIDAILLTIADLRRGAPDAGGAGSPQ